MLKETRITVMITLGVCAGIYMYAQTKPETKPDTDIPDSIKAQVARTQRDYLSAQIQMDRATKALQDAQSTADAACSKMDRAFDPSNIVCVEKPPVKK